MSKVTKRKITVESASNKLSSNSTNKDSQRRQSVFERLGTKTGASLSLNTGIGGPQPSSGENFCRHWSQNGTCPYGKSCVFVNTHVLISPSKRNPKKEFDPKQVLSRGLEEGLKLEGLKRLNSSIVRRGSPDLNWEAWDQTNLEYEDEKVLEKRLHLLQRELELEQLQMKGEDTEEHHSKRKHSNPKQKKGISSSSSTSVSSTSSESSSSSDSSSDSSSSGLAVNSKRRRSKTNKSKRRSTSSVSDSDRKKVRDSSKPMHKDRSPSNMSRKSASSRDKRAFTPPKKSAPNAKLSRKKSLSPNHRSHNTATTSSKTKPSKSSQGGSRHNLSPRPSKRSTSLERKEKHKRSLSPRPRSKTAVKERSPRRQDARSRRKDSPDTRPRNNSRSRLPDTRNDDRKKDDDRSRNKDDRRQDRKPASDRDKRDHDDARAREKAREAAREKEREEALERCRERQREREQLAKEKERNRDRPRDDRDKDSVKQRDYEKSLPQLMTVNVYNQADRSKLPDRDRDRPNKERKDREKDREKDNKDRDRDRVYDRSLDKLDRNRLLEKDRLPEKLPDRDRGNDKDRPRERLNINERNREKGDRDRSYERDRNSNRNTGEATERSFDKDRTSKAIDRNRDRDFDRDKDRNFDSRRSFEKAGERERTPLEKDRGVVRDRVLELRERNKSLERGRASDGERSVERNRERYDREGRFDRRTLVADEKGYESPYDTRRDRSRYGTEGSERTGIFKELSPSREDARGLRHTQGFNEERRSRGGRDARGGWEQRGSYDDPGTSKARDWDYPDSRRDWNNRHGDWEGTGEGEEWGRYGGDWGGDWREDWQQHRPPRHPPRDDQTIVSSNHIVVRDTSEDSGGRRIQGIDNKDLGAIGDFKKENIDSGKALDSGSHKRQREDSDIPVEAKKPRLEDPLPLGMLEEVLSDISDDPDEILNREDIDVAPQESCAMDEDVRPSAVTIQSSSHELDQKLLEEDENIDNLDFEEISDEELEEEARANKGLGDALGVDWASLVAESRPRQAEAAPGAARRRWQPVNILARIGVSMQYAGAELYNTIQQQLTDKKEEEDEKEKVGLLHPVATLHVALRDRQARRRCLFSGTDTFKRALSARTDIAIRRQLCNLPVASLEMQQSSGFCQWVV